MYRQKTLMVNSEQKELIDNKDISTVSVNVGGYMGTESSWNHVNDISLEEKGRSLFFKSDINNQYCRREHSRHIFYTFDVNIAFRF